MHDYDKLMAFIADNCVFAELGNRSELSRKAGKATSEMSLFFFFFLLFICRFLKDVVALSRQWRLSLSRTKANGKRAKHSLIGHWIQRKWSRNATMRNWNDQKTEILFRSATWWCTNVWFIDWIWIWFTGMYSTWKISCQSGRTDTLKDAWERVDNPVCFLLPLLLLRCHWMRWNYLFRWSECKNVGVKNKIMFRRTMTLSTRNWKIIWNI